MLEFTDLHPEWYLHSSQQYSLQEACAQKRMRENESWQGHMVIDITMSHNRHARCLASAYLPVMSKEKHIVQRRYATVVHLSLSVSLPFPLVSKTDVRAWMHTHIHTH